MRAKAGAVTEDNNVADPMIANYTERQQIEKQYHDQKFRDGTLEGTSEGRIQRAFQRYWDTIGRPANRTILDFGCGEGWLSVALAQLGNQVHGFDISEVLIERARRRAESAAVSDRVTFHEMAAEQLSFPEETFDLIIGNSILHHTELDLTLRNIRKVLKPNGTAIFLEPMNQSLFLRAWRLATPWRRSRTERALTNEDLDLVRSLFPSTRFNYFCFASMFTEGLKLALPRSAVLGAINRRFEDLDEFLLARFPSIGRYSAVVVLEMRK